MSKHGGARQGTGPKKRYGGKPVIISASVPTSCTEAVAEWQKAKEPKYTKGDVICAALRLAERHPDEFQQLLQSESP